MFLSTNNWNLLVFVVTAEEHRFFVVILAYCWYSTAALAARHEFPLIAQCFGCNITAGTGIACMTLLGTGLRCWIIRIVGLDSDTSTTFVTFIIRNERTFWKLIKMRHAISFNETTFGLIFLTIIFCNN